MVILILVVIQVDDVGDVKKVKKKRKAVDLVREREQEELRVLLETYGGRSFVWRILIDFCGIYKTGITDSLDTFRELGRRDVGLWILAEVFNSSPDIYTVMRNEASDRNDNLEKINE